MINGSRAPHPFALPAGAYFLVLNNFNSGNMSCESTVSVFHTILLKHHKTRHFHFQVIALAQLPKVAKEARTDMSVTMALQVTVRQMRNALQQQHSRNMTGLLDVEHVKTTSI